MRHLSAPVQGGRPGDRTPPKPAPPPPPFWRRYLIPVGLVLTGWLLFGALSKPASTLRYSDFLGKVEAGQVSAVTIRSDGGITGQLTAPPGERRDFRTTAPSGAVTDRDLLPLLRDRKVAITAKGAGSAFWAVVVSFLPTLLLVGFFVWMGRRSADQMGGIAALGRSRAKLFDGSRPSTTLADVAGYDGVKQEVIEVVDFLKDPAKYRRAGAAGPRGVLMTGPPGVGKTLLARAVAGEAGVPFFSVSGSSFVEMFVGVGASRVRDLFTEARKRAPAIVFIDEIDAIGGRRGSNVYGSNDERDQTLNQLLAEMDGFDPAAGVVVMAATNRPEILDPALMRPGRFDRHVDVPLPTLGDREAILAVHTRDKKLAPDVDLRVVARGTPGFSGADLANLVNEAAIHAVRAGRDTITAADFDSARERIVLGRREGSNVLLPEEKVAVAVHESGHAIVAALCPNAERVSKVTILPAGFALGFTEQLPEVERRLYTERYLRDSLAVRLGGRAAELAVFGEASTGAANDLAGATDLATRMVVEFGLSPALGPVGYSPDGPGHLGPQGPRRLWSEGTQRVIDTEVARLVREAEDRATDLITGHRSALDALTDRLLEQEIVDGAEVYALLGGERVPAPAVKG
ncbi:MAG: cell division protease FtsH [Actinomycetota bacterium]|nr:cell division protease FtsH [Actinomycetota bacterium]